MRFLLDVKDLRGLCVTGIPELNGNPAQTVKAVRAESINSPQ